MSVSSNVLQVCSYLLLTLLKQTRAFCSSAAGDGSSQNNARNHMASCSVLNCLSHQLNEYLHAVLTFLFSVWPIFHDLPANATKLAPKNHGKWLFYFGKYWINSPKEDMFVKPKYITALTSQPLGSSGNGIKIFSRI